MQKCTVFHFCLLSYVQLHVDPFTVALVAVGVRALGGNGVSRQKRGEILGKGMKRIESSRICCLIEKGFREKEA